MIPWLSPNPSSTLLASGAVRPLRGRCCRGVGHTGANTETLSRPTELLQVDPMGLFGLLREIRRIRARCAMDLIARSPVCGMEKRHNP